MKRLLGFTSLTRLLFLSERFQHADVHWLTEVISAAILGGHSSLHWSNFFFFAIRYLFACTNFSLVCLHFGRFQWCTVYNDATDFRIPIDWPRVNRHKSEAKYWHVGACHIQRNQIDFTRRSCMNVTWRRRHAPKVRRTRKLFLFFRFDWSQLTLHFSFNRVRFISPTIFGRVAMRVRHTAETNARPPRCARVWINSLKNKTPSRSETYSHHRRFRTLLSSMRSMYAVHSNHFCDKISVFIFLSFTHSSTFPPHPFPPPPSARCSVLPLLIRLSDQVISIVEWNICI